MYNWRTQYEIYTEMLIMTFFERTKHCTKRFPCRFKLALMVFSVALAASIVAVPFISHLA